MPIWYCNDGGIGSVSSNQAAAMTTNGAPNDLLNSFNALTIVVTIPFLTYISYPMLAYYHIKFGRISRITCGFLIAVASSVVGAILQYRVYKTSPCGYSASTCDGVSPVSVWWSITYVILAAWSECFCAVTSYELAYARAPPSMRGLLTGIFLFMNAMSAAIGEILIPVTKDPFLIWIWAAPAVALFMQTIIFWFRFRHMNNDEFMLDHDTDRGQQAGSMDNSDVEVYSHEKI
jgi:dipeptide/tripeptide permease